MSHSLLNIRTAVKQECRVAISGSLDTMINRIINDTYQKLCQNVEYDELFVPESVLTIASDQQTIFTKPADFRKLAYVEYSTDNLSWVRLTKRNQFSLPLTEGYPRWWFLSSLGIKIFPYTSVLTSHFVRIAYWKVPPALAIDADIILVDTLYNAIVERTMDRVMRYHNEPKDAQMWRQDAMESEGRVVE